MAGDRMAKVSRCRRRAERGQARADRCELQSALAELGESLLRCRAAAVWAAEGFDSFEAWCRARVPAMFRLPPAQSKPRQVDEFVAMVDRGCRARARGGGGLTCR